MPMVNHDYVVFDNPVLKHTVKKTDGLQAAAQWLIWVFVIYDGITAQDDSFYDSGAHSSGAVMTGARCVSGSLTSMGMTP